MVVRTAIFDIQLWWISVEQIVLSHQIMLFEKKVEFLHRTSLCCLLHHWLGCLCAASSFGCLGCNNILFMIKIVLPPLYQNVFLFVGKEPIFL